MVERYNYIDFLRFIGLTLIILAHVQAPHTITQIRCFDVPLMVFVSGLSFSGKTINPTWKEFYYPRIKRLLIPVYLFISLYMLFWWVIKKPFTLTEVLGSYLLLEEPSMNYIWIIKVFLLIMLVTPMLVHLNNRLKTGWFLVVIVCLFLIQEGIVYLCSFFCPHTLFGVFSKESITSFVGYSIPFMLGLRVKSLKIEKTLQAVVSTLIVIVIALVLYYTIYGFPVEISPRFKYPPQFFFIVYGTSVSVLLWVLRRYLEWAANNKLVLFIGRNTIWIYLWHIPFVYIANRFLDGWALKYLFVFMGAVTVFGIQYYNVKKLSEKTQYTFCKYLLG